MVCKNREGGGARIVDKFKKDPTVENLGQIDKSKQIPLLTSKAFVKKTGQRCSVAELSIS